MERLWLLFGKWIWINRKWTKKKRTRRSCLAKLMMLQKLRILSSASQVDVQEICQDTLISIRKLDLGTNLETLRNAVWEISSDAYCINRIIRCYRPCSLTGKYEHCHSSHVSRVQLEPNHRWFDSIFFLLGLPPHSGRELLPFSFSLLFVTVTNVLHIHWFLFELNFTDSSSASNL